MESRSDGIAAPALPEPGTLLGCSPLPAEFWPADRALWRAVAARSDTDDDGRVSGVEFLRWINSRAAHADGFDNDIRPLAQAVVSLVDDDHSGTLESAEFFRLLRACELPDDQARRVFDTLDVDDDGSVSSAEIIAAMHDFCLDPAPDKPGHWLFGQF